VAKNPLHESLDDITTANASNHIRWKNSDAALPLTQVCKEVLSTPMGDDNDVKSIQQQVQPKVPTLFVSMASSTTKPTRSEDSETPMDGPDDSAPKSMPKQVEEEKLSKLMEDIEGIASSPPQSPDSSQGRTCAAPRLCE
jgi:hypothetical protein